MHGLMNVSKEDKADSWVSTWWKKNWLAKLVTEERVAEISHGTSEEHCSVLKDARTMPLWRGTIPCIMQKRHKIKLRCQRL